MHSSKKDSHCTPAWFIELVWQFGDVALDPCANLKSITGAFKECWKTTPSRGAPTHVLLDGLWQEWRKVARRGLVYMNPPYGRDIGPWLEKCDEEARAGVEIIALVPARTDTKWYQGARRDADVEVLGRLTFEGSTSPAPFPSSVFYWGRRVERFAELFGPLGRLHVTNVGQATALQQEREIRDGQRQIRDDLAAHTKTRCVLYHRVSTVDQDPAGAQLELYKAAEARGLTVALELQETGSGANNDRPKLQQALELARAGAVGAVLVWKLDRFGRSALDLLHNLKELEAAGCRFICTSQNIDLRTGGDPMSRLLVQLLAAVAEFELELIRERTRNGLKRARERGAQLGRPRKEGPPLERVRALRAAGKSWMAIAAALDCGVMQARRAIQGEQGKL